MTGLLLDENLTDVLAEALGTREPATLVCCIGDESAPNVGTGDPVILNWLEEHGFVLVTNNRASMPVHLAAHLAAGGHVPGILQVPKAFQIGPLADAILLWFGASLPGELADHITYISLSD